MSESSEQGDAGDLSRLDIEQLWAEVNRVLRSGPVNRSLWDAAIKAVPVALEGDTLVVGLPSPDMRYAGYIETATNRSKLVEIIQNTVGHRLQLRVIEGTTPAAWERVKELGRLAEERAEASQAIRDARRGSAGAWEHLNREIMRVFTATTLRRHPTTVARMLLQALALVYETDHQVRAEDAEGAADHERELNRLLEKLATYCEIPPTVVALEYMRYATGRRRTAAKGQQ
jgi:hypothetical protein